MSSDDPAPLACGVVLGPPKASSSAAVPPFWCDSGSDERVLSILHWSAYLVLVVLDFGLEMTLRTHHETIITCPLSLRPLLRPRCIGNRMALTGLALYFDDGCVALWTSLLRA